MEALFEQLIQLATDFGARLFAAIAIFVVGRWGVKLAQRLIRRLMIHANVDPTLVSFVSNLSYFGGLAFVILAVLSQLGVETTSLIAVLGAAGLAIGLALQGSLANFAAGILMIIFRPFRVNDWIEAAGTSGIVEEMQIFTTRLRTLNNREVIIPNSKLTSDNIINHSAKPHIRMDLVFGVAYGEDMDHVKRAIAAVLDADERICRDPAPVIGVLELADSSVKFAVRPWVKPSDYWDVYLSLHEQIKKRFDTDGITIPFPQRDVHLISQNPPQPPIV